MTSARELHRRTQAKLQPGSTPPADADERALRALMCRTSGCGRRWTVDLAHGKRCSECDARLVDGDRVVPTRSLFPPTAAPAGAQPPEDFDDEPLPF